MLTNSSERASARRSRLQKGILEFSRGDLFKLFMEYYRLLLDQKVNLLINEKGEEAIALRGEIRLLKSLIASFDATDTPFTDSIDQ